MTPRGGIEESDITVPQTTRHGEIDDILVEGLTFQEFKDRAEAAFIKKQLESSGWNVSKTAEILQIQRSHLYSKMKKYGLERS
jgi:DNA-binding NtrC family response regulator